MPGLAEIVNRPLSLVMCRLKRAGLDYWPYVTVKYASHIRMPLINKSCATCVRGHGQTCASLGDMQDP
jgi:hypothetical protein